jgi:hypothetical protein
VHPGQDFSFGCGLIREPSIQALGGERGELNLGHVQPTPFLGRIVELKALGPGKRSRRRQYLIERAGRMRIQIILDQPDAVNSRIMQAQEVLQKVRIIDRSASRPGLHVAKPSVGLERQQDTAGAVALIFIIHAPGLSRLHGERDQDIAQQLTRTLIITEQRRAGVIRAGVLIKDIFQVPEILAGNLPEAPAPIQPGFEGIFLTLCARSRNRWPRPP